MLLTDHEDVVELVDAVDLGEKLIDDGVVDGSTSGHRAARLADGVDFVEDDDVQPTVDAQLNNTRALYQTLLLCS